MTAISVVHISVIHVRVVHYCDGGWYVCRYSVAWGFFCGWVSRNAECGMRMRRQKQSKQKQLALKDRIGCGDSLKDDDTLGHI